MATKKLKTRPRPHKLKAKSRPAWEARISHEASQLNRDLESIRVSIQANHSEVEHYVRSIRDYAAACSKLGQHPELRKSLKIDLLADRSNQAYRRFQLVIDSIPPFLNKLNQFCATLPGRYGGFVYAIGKLKTRLEATETWTGTDPLVTLDVLRFRLTEIKQKASRKRLP